MNRNFVLFIFLLAISSPSFAQKKGVVIDELTKRPIPYVNIRISGTKTGINTDEKGLFEISGRSSDILLLSAVGFEDKKMAFKTVTDTIELVPVIYDLDEVTISSKGNTEQKIGRLNLQIAGYYRSGVTITAYYYPYKDKYKKTPYLKNIQFITNSHVKNAKFNIRLYNKAPDGSPGEMIYHKPIIGVARKGIHKMVVSLENLYLQFPSTGLFVAIEWLNFNENIYEEIDINGMRSEHIAPSFTAYRKDNKREEWFLTDRWRRSQLNKAKVQMKILLRE
nr:carboxypeptidase-like regulatory domain-containing protein [uncultured Carboxylicivirga sp.]